MRKLVLLIFAQVKELQVVAPSLATLILLLFLANSVTLMAEEQESKSGSVKVAADLASRYIWRGSDFGNSASIQPSLAYSIKGLNVGFWGCYPLAYESANYDEIDLYASYTISSRLGSFTPTITDYSFPYLGRKFFDFGEDSTGAHTVECALGFTGTTKFPITFLVAVNVHNDEENSAYYELSYPLTLNDVSMIFWAGAEGGKSVWYGVDDDKLTFINLGVSATKEIKVTDEFALPMTGSFMINPHTEMSFLVLKLSF